MSRATTIEVPELSDEQLLKSRKDSDTGKWTARVADPKDKGNFHTVELNDDQIAEAKRLQDEHGERQRANAELAKEASLEIDEYLNPENPLSGINKMALQIISGLLNEERKALKFKDVTDDQKVMYRYFGVCAGNVLPKIPEIVRVLSEQATALAEHLETAGREPVQIDNFVNTAMVAMEATNFRMSQANKMFTIRKSLANLRRERAEQGLDKKSTDAGAANWQANKTE